MTNVAIVTTSINARPPAYAQWQHMGQLIVAGDVNSPNELSEYVATLGGSYLGATQQSFPGSEYVPFACIQRRNAAIWWAYAWDYDYVVSVDDDNFPVRDTFVNELVHELGQLTRATVGGRSSFINLGELCLPWTHQRGTPYGVDTRIGDITHWPGDRPGEQPRIVVAQAMVLGDPDCDAIERICNAPDVKAIQNRIVVTPGTYAAFNSQATAWLREWAPVAAVLPHVGRYDDIFASFIFHRMAKTYHVALYAGDPVVKQERNEHNLQRDLQQELYGMRRVFDFCAALDHAHISSDMPLWMSYGELISAVSHLLPPDTVRFAEAWSRGWREQCERS